MARAIRAHCLACGQSAADIALMIHSQCGPAIGTRLVRAQRLALGIALADVVAQVRARYVNEGRTAPRFSETLLSSYEGGQKRPGPEYLHYLCCVYQAEPADLGYEGPCLCGQQHRAPVLTLPGPAPVAAPRPAGTGWPAGYSGAVPGAGLTAPPILTAVPSTGDADPAEPAAPGPGAAVAGPTGLTATQLPALEPPDQPRPDQPPPAPAPADTGPAYQAYPAELDLIRSAARHIGDVALRYRTLFRRLGPGLDGTGGLAPSTSTTCAACTRPSRPTSVMRAPACADSGTAPRC